MQLASGTRSRIPYSNRANAYADDYAGTNEKNMMQNTGGTSPFRSVD